MVAIMRITGATSFASLWRSPHQTPFTYRGVIGIQRRLFNHTRTLSDEIIVKVPMMAESISEGTLASFTRKIGDSIEGDEEIASIETDKIDVAVNAPEAAIILEYFAAEGDTVVVGQDLARIETSHHATDHRNNRGDTEAQQLPAKQPNNDSTPSKPSGRFGIMDRTDQAVATVRDLPTPKNVAESRPVVTECTPELSGTGTAAGPSRVERVEKMSRMRRTIASRLKQSQNTCASLTTIQEVDMSHLIAWRARYKEEVAEKYGVRLGYMGAFVKATTIAAQQVPQINAAIDTDKNIITFRDYVDISIAVSAPKGLVTPVLRNSHRLSIIQVEREVAALAGRARDSKLTMNDLEGGNFSISNPGIFGSMFGTPVINYPQAAVFNMNGIQERVMAIDGKAVIRPMMYISLTYDHRLIDGREAVSFLNIVKKNIESPSRMLLTEERA